MAAIPADCEALLDRAVEHGCRVVALRLLESACDAHGRLERAADDADALHDFRVAVRRLRSWLRAYRAPLGGSVRRKAHRRLRRIAAATDVGRDTDVQIAWIEAHPALRRGSRRAGTTWLLERLGARRRDAEQEMRVALGKRFPSVREELIGRLEEYTISARVHGTPEVTPFAAASAALVREQSAELRDRLAGVHAADDRREAHRARIAAKRLRYLLEPLQACVEGAADAVERLRTLQDLLGDMHDAQALADEVAEAMEAGAVEQARRLAESALAGTSDDETARRARRHDPRAGLLAVARELHARVERDFDALERDWLGDAADACLSDVGAVADRLAARHAAGVEIERKYLLDALPDEARGAPVEQIVQGYLPGDRLAERLRAVERDGVTHWYRTMKLGRGLSRVEVEESTTRELFEGMWPLTEGRRVRKRRYRVAAGAHVWEIDDFLDRALVLAEVELPSEDTPVELPPWLEAHVEREVTGEDAYVNLNLAR